MSRKGLRAYVVELMDGSVSGIAMRQDERLFDSPPPSALAATEREVLERIEAQLIARVAAGDDSYDRYLWDETFEVRSVRVDVNPLTFVKKQPVIGARSMPIRLSYAWSKMQSGSYRIVLPRFGWWMIVERLEMAGSALRSAVAAELLGSNPRWLFEFRAERAERVRGWEPGSFERKKRDRGADDDDVPELAAVAEEWVDRAQQRKLPAPVGAPAGVDELLSEAERMPPGSVLLVGPSGVGKTALVRAVAQRLVGQRRAGRAATVPRIWATSVDRILAGTPYVGMWQARCLQIVSSLRHAGDILYVDSLPPLLDRRADGGSIAAILEPALAAEEISVWAECRDAELERCRRDAPSLLSHFRILHVREPAPRALPELLEAYRRRHGPEAELHPGSYRRLVQHLDAFDRATALPGKALTFFDWLALQPEGRRERAIYPVELSELFSRYSGVPVRILAEDHAGGSDVIAESLRSRVIGQDHACASAARVVARLKAGLNDPDRPIGSLLFVGPTGVGKTELAKQLARELFGGVERMIRLDMSEYAAPDGPARLLATGRGVTSLAERVRRQPLSLVLFDEVEKAHPLVFDALLGILGEGRASDLGGRAVDFRTTLIVMTSNLGAGGAPPVGFGGAQLPDFTSAVRAHFRPEFFNRIDRVVPFRALSPADIRRIVELELDAVARRPGLVERRLKLIVSDGAKQRLAELGYHPRRGARPLERVIEERVVTPLSVRIAARPALSDRTVRVDAVDGDASGAILVSVD